MFTQKPKFGAEGFVKSILAKRQLFFILVFSSTITLIGTLIQLFVEYRTDAAYIQEQFRQIKRAHLESLTWSLWKFDNVQINTQLNSILSHRDIIYIQIREKGKVLYEVGNVDQQSMTKSMQYEMIYDHHGVKEVIGTVKATASFEGLVQRMRNRILIVLSTQGFKTFFVSLFILYIINRLVIRHLATISEFAKSLQPETLDRQLLLDRQASTRAEPDELDLIVTSINDMRERLIDDIDKIKNTKEALRESEERFRTAFEADAIGRVLTAIDGGLLRTNRCLTDMLGYSSEELSRLSFTDITYDEDLSASKECVRSLLSKERDTYRLEKRYVRKDGSILWADVSTVLLFDEDGKPIHFITGIQDISERKRTEEALRASEEKYRNLFETLPIGMYRTSSKGRILDVNPALVEILNYPDKESLLIMKSKDIYVDTEDRERWAALIKTEKVVTNYIKRIRTHDGQVIWVEENARAIFDEEQRIKWYEGSIINITDRIKAEEKKTALEIQLRQAQKMEAIGTLAGGIAHDFNNMLSVVIGNAELAMINLTSEDPIRNRLETIQSTAQRSADLVRQLLAFARKQTIAPKLLNINETIAGMIKMLRQLIGEDIDLAWLPGSDAGKVSMDPSQVDQILANLMVNARDAINGVGKVTIETGNIVIDEDYCDDHPGFLPGRFVMTAVSDSGVGMDEDTMSQVFDPFFSTKDAGYGTGLGLATVYGIVKQNNGFINVYSEPGQGTTFKIYLPLVETMEDTASLKPIYKVPPRGNETVMIVEDDEAILELGQSILEQHGYTVLIAATPDAAIKMAESYKHPIDLLITDVVMPQMNGRQLVQRLNRESTNLKCLFMSGYTANVIAQHGILDKEVNFLNKPFSVVELASKVREVLDEVNTPCF